MALAALLSLLVLALMANLVSVHVLILTFESLALGGPFLVTGYSGGEPVLCGTINFLRKSC